MRIPAKVTYALLLSALLVSCCLNTGSMEPVTEGEQLPLEEPVNYEATEGRDESSSSASSSDSAALGVAVLGLVVVAAVPLPLAAGILYVWANSLASDQPDTGTRNVFSASDAASSTSDNGGDTLLKLSFGYAEDDLKWAFVDIKIEVGDNVHDCGFDATDSCQIGEQDDDGAWGASEHITLSEGTDNIVGAGGADVNIFIKYRTSQVSGDASETVA